mgnify:CR=1 FL=1
MTQEMRTAELTRRTGETDIRLRLCLDGTGSGNIDTGIGFFDHMLQGFARHGLFDLDVKVDGDLHIDGHHTVEDTGIVLGQAFAKALGDKAGIRRYGSACVPMDEVLVLAAVDLSGRPYLAFDGFEFASERVGGFDSELTLEFFRAFSTHAAMNLHLRCLAGGNTHHLIEATFKACARALDQATQFDARVRGIPSTKGSL